MTKPLAAAAVACLMACAPVADGGEQERIRAEAPPPPADEDHGLKRTLLANGCFEIEMKPSAKGGLAIPRQVICPELPGFDIEAHAARQEVGREN